MHKLVLLVVAVLLPSLIVADQMCTTDYLHIRPHPNTVQDPKWTARPGDSFEIKSVSGDWYQVIATSGDKCGQDGYASRYYFEACGGSTCDGGDGSNGDGQGDGSNGDGSSSGGGGATGDGRWLTSVTDGTNTYTVTKLDRSSRRSPVSHDLPVNKFLLHTLEGAWPSYGDWESGTSVLDGNTYWPHFIVAMDRSGTVRIGQYLPLNVGAYALKTGNHDGVIQVEIGAKADSPFTSIPDHSITNAVRALFKGLQTVTDIPNSVDSKVRFTSNGAWGESAPQRLSKSDFQSVQGLVGHQHVYGNDHWDPGAINPNALL